MTYTAYDPLHYRILSEGQGPTKKLVPGILLRPATEETCSGSSKSNHFSRVANCILDQIRSHLALLRVPTSRDRHFKALPPEA